MAQNVELIQRILEHKHKYRAESSQDVSTSGSTSKPPAKSLSDTPTSEEEFRVINVSSKIIIFLVVKKHVVYNIF